MTRARERHGRVVFGKAEEAPKENDPGVPRLPFRHFLKQAGKTGREPRSFIENLERSPLGAPLPEPVGASWRAPLSRPKDGTLVPFVWRHRGRPTKRLPITPIQRADFELIAKRRRRYPLRVRKRARAFLMMADAMPAPVIARHLRVHESLVPKLRNRFKPDLLAIELVTDAPRSGRPPSRKSSSSKS